MRVCCIGGGPAGLYLGITLKLRDPSHEVVVMERNQPGDTFGWGVVFSDETMRNLTANDPESADAMRAELAHWELIDTWVNGERERSDGHGFIGIGRKRMLQILYDRAAELGVELAFGTEFDLAELDALRSKYDLVVGADGLNSKIRNANLEAFDCDLEMRPNKFVWLGTKQSFRDAFTFIFEKTRHGWIWAHAYQFDNDTSTFIVECNPDVYDAFGFEHMSHDESAETCRQIFAAYLDGHELMTNSSHIRGSAWINFPRVLCRNWILDNNLVLIGDAAHTAHFSIGSGTKLGLEDALSLANHLHEDPDLPTALRRFQDTRMTDALRLQSAARNAMIWFENVPRYLEAFDLKQFNYSLLTRSQRVSHENLRLRDADWLAGMERHLYERTTGKPMETPTPPMFLPLELRGMHLRNRVVVSPMSMYQSTDGMPGPWHLSHYTTFARGGAGLIYSEMTDVSPEGRITHGCPGIWNEEQAAAWKDIVEAVHEVSDARFAMQLSHAGPKASTLLPWEDPVGDSPLEENGWEVLSASAIPYAPHCNVPRAMTRADMDEVLQQHVDAARRADEAGFDMLEIHAAHGYLLSAFITPLLNHRDDEYGGSLENRLRYPLEVFAAVRAAWPQDKPMSVRISATDWVDENGITEADAIEIARAFAAAGADAIDVSAGQTSTEAKPVYGRMFQTPFADAVRNEVGVCTMAVGNIFDVDHVNSIIAAGRADLCCLARPHLMDPFWTLRAAAQLNYQGEGVIIPPQYQAGFDQLGRNLARAADMAINA